MNNKSVYLVLISTFCLATYGGMFLKIQHIAGYVGNIFIAIGLLALIGLLILATFRLIFKKSNTWF
jgi:hypothetical protein